MKERATVASPTDTYLFSKDAKPGANVIDPMIYGGKGAGLIKMALAGFNVPPGVVIPVHYCKKWGTLSDDVAKNTMIAEIIIAIIAPSLNWIKAKLGYEPMYSVRSGAPVSMPGMMDTILNVGAFDSGPSCTIQKLSLRAIYDCQRRLIQMLGTTAFSIEASIFDFQKSKVLAELGLKSEYDLDRDGMQKLAAKFEWAFEEATGKKFPHDRFAQLNHAIRAVFDSWNSDRAIEYRKLNKIPATYGTAVVIQAMVFGNINENSGTGVLFTRNPSTGEGGLFGEFLVNAQGEDVVAGTSTPRKIEDMLGMPEWFGIHSELEDTCIKLEAMYSDMVDCEFTVQDGELFILQSRTGKRSALAAFVIAHDMIEGKLLSHAQGFGRITREQFITIRKPSIDPAFKDAPDHVGLPACPGVVKGIAVHTSEEAVASTVPCILVREETSPDDIAGMAKAAGILTRTGGATSHAAVVARAMDKPCVVGCTTLIPDDVVGLVTIDGTTGNVWFGVDVPVVDAQDGEIVKAMMGIACASQCYIPHKLTPDCDGPYRIHVADHWTDEGLETLFYDLVATDCPLTSLDCRGPSMFAGTDDEELEYAFGAVPDQNGMAMKLVDMLRHHAKQLTGMILIAPPMSQAEVEKLGYNYQTAEGKLPALPAETATFMAIKKAHA